MPPTVRCVDTGRAGGECRACQEGLCKWKRDGCGERGYGNVKDNLSLGPDTGAIGCDGGPGRESDTGRTRMGLGHWAQVTSARGGQSSWVSCGDQGR